MTICKSQTFWVGSWREHLDEYLQVPPRMGMYLELLFCRRPYTFLELGGGSMRDSNYLARRGYRATGSDNAPEVVEAARNAHGNAALGTLVIDAFSTGIPDGAYDVTFHNGLWINFDSDSAIKVLLQEQARISSRWIVVAVPCAENPVLRAGFARKAINDPLYDVRWFSREDLLCLLAPYGPTKVYPFGARLDKRLILSRWFRPLPLRFRSLLYRCVCPYQNIERWEKTIAVTRLSK